MRKKTGKTSWEKVSKWYDKSVGKSGHYYHENVVIPGIERLIKFNKGAEVRFLDLACGQGILARSLPKTIHYTGVDISPSLIKSAKKTAPTQKHAFLVGDITKPLPVDKRNFTHATIILALQNVQDGAAAVRNAATHLQSGGVLLLVLNHPCFRIPRQTSWGVEKEKKIQYRRLDRYLSPLEIPILANPGKGKDSEKTWSYHHPISTYTQWLFEAGFRIEVMEEWCSDKTSTGGAAKMENRARKEFPLFLAIRACRA